MRIGHIAILLASATLTGACGADDESGSSSGSSVSVSTGAATTATTEHTHPATEIAATAPGESAGQPIAGVEQFGSFARDHVDGAVQYEQSPPVGGPHNQVWQTCQFYDTPIPDERGVHSLEHGAVWITFDPALPDDQIAAIRALADGRREVLASPYDALPTPVVASAWGVQFQLDSALDPDLATFADFYENGPQTPEANVPCAQGTTETS